MNRYSIVILLISLLFITSCKMDNSQKQPNIIFIMSDDHAQKAISAYSNGLIKTPNIDSLAKNGIRFTDFHSNGAVCSPTRAALMTGRYQQRSGIEGVVTALNHRHTGLDPNELTIADFFKKQEYKTGIVGKWYLGYDTIYSPTKNGFDY